MVKKVPAIIALTILISWFAYRAVHSPVPRTEVVIESETSTSLEKNTPASIKVKHQVKKSQTRSAEATTDNSFDVFDQMEQKWQKAVEDIFDEKEFSRYVQMRDESEKETMVAYKEYHDYLRKKYGDKFSYNISEDQSIREKEINQRYLKALLKLVGVEKFKLYTTARDQFNENMRRQKKESIQIEF
jgi:hypothetical protein